MKKSVQLVQLYHFEVLKLLLKLVVILKPMIVMSVPVWFWKLKVFAIFVFRQKIIMEK